MMRMSTSSLDACALRAARGVACAFALTALSVSCAGSGPTPAAQNPTQAPASAPVSQAPGFGDSTTTLTPTLASSPAGAPAPASALSQPNAIALPCATDVQCLTHRCNVAVGKCTWPCQRDSDCMPGNACVAPTCLPKLQ